MDQMLPGFEPDRPGENKIQQAARLQLQALADDDLLGPDKAILTQLVMQLSTAVGNSLQSGKLSIAGVQGAKLLVEALEQLPETEAGGMSALVSELRAVS